MNVISGGIPNNSGRFEVALIKIGTYSKRSRVPNG